MVQRSRRCGRRRVLEEKLACLKKISPQHQEGKEWISTRCIIISIKGHSHWHITTSELACPKIGFTVLPSVPRSAPWAGFSVTPNSPTAPFNLFLPAIPPVYPCWRNSGLNLTLSLTSAAERHSQLPSWYQSWFPSSLPYWSQSRVYIYWVWPCKFIPLRLLMTSNLDLTVQTQACQTRSWAHSCLPTSSDHTSSQWAHYQ